MKNLGQVHGFPRKQAVNHLFCQVCVNAEHGLGGRILYHGYGLAGLAIQVSRYATGIEYHLYGTDDHTADQCNGQYPPKDTVAKAIFNLKEFLHSAPSLACSSGAQIHVAGQCRKLNITHCREYGLWFRLNNTAWSIGEFIKYLRRLTFQIVS